MNNTDESCSFNRGFIRFHVECEIFLNRHIAQFVSIRFSKHLPWNNVTMMFHFCQYDCPAFQLRVPPCMCCKIDGFCCTACKNATFGIEPGFERGSTRFVAIGCFTGEGVDCTVNICIVFCVIVVHGINDNSRFLCCCCIVEVNEAVSIDLSLQNRKIVLDRHGITQ